jgi:hypothetical protein
MIAGSKAGTAALWKTWQRVHPLYRSVAQEVALETRPCNDLEAGVGVPSAEAIADTEAWFAAMDQEVHIHHLRHFAQTSALMTEQAISDLLFYFLNKKQKTEQDRDKVDFLAVQLLAMRLPLNPTASAFTLESVMRLLAPAIGTGEEIPNFARDLDEMLAESDDAKNLNALFTSRVIERTREIKQSCGDAFFNPASLAVFARFGYLIRRRFFQLMQDDLHSILDGLLELEGRGVTTIDCRRAQFSAEEPINRIRMICQSWRVMFQAEYSAGQPLCLLVDLKTAVESAATSRTAQGPSNKLAASAAVPGDRR